MNEEDLQVLTKLKSKIHVVCGKSISIEHTRAFSAVNWPTDWAPLRSSSQSSLAINTNDPVFLLSSAGGRRDVSLFH